MPARAAARRYSLLVCADTKGKVKEAKETNNCRTAAAIDVVAPPAAGGGGRARRSRSRSPGPSRCPRTPRRPRPRRSPHCPPPARPPRRSRPRSPSRRRTSRRSRARASRSPPTRPSPASSAGSTTPRSRACTSPHTIPSILAGEHAFEVRAFRGAVFATTARKPWRIEFEAPAVGPTDAPAAAPETQATTADAGEITLVSDTTEFLYTGANPIQKDVEDDAIEETRAAVLRGKVLRRNGSPIDGVRVTVVDHPELGRTATRTDGGFEIAVNGGGAVDARVRARGLRPLAAPARGPDAGVRGASRRSCSSPTRTASPAST